MRKLAWAVCIFLVFSSIPVWASSEMPNGTIIAPNGIRYISHAPILILAHEDFNAAHGVAGGNGTIWNPWIIENYEIEGTHFYDYCIGIVNTTDYFIIRDCYLHHSTIASIGLYNVQNGTIINNIILNNKHSTAPMTGTGIFLQGSSCFNTIDSNIVSNNYYGIRIFNSNYTTLVNNTMDNDSIIIQGNLLGHYNTQIIDVSNKVNGKPVYYLKNQIGGSIPAGAGEVILANCTQVTVANQNVSMGTVGIELAHSTYNIIRNNLASFNIIYGFEIVWSSNNTIANNTANYCGVGFHIGKSNNNAVINNSASWTKGIAGIFLSSSNDNNIGSNNNISSCTSLGIYFDHSNRNNISNNTAWVNGYGIKIGVGSTFNNIIENVVMRNAYGISIDGQSNHNSVIANNVINNRYGINIQVSNYDTIIENFIHSNTWGIYVAYTSVYNTIYHNNIINNTNQAYDSKDTNNWDNGYPSGGNFWSDYLGEDYFSGINQTQLGGDGFGDTPYTNIPGGPGTQDDYPLMVPWGTPLQRRYIHIPVLPGWNLISIPFETSSHNLPYQLLDIDNDTYWTQIRYYNSTDNMDHWKQYRINGPPEMNDLDSVDRTMGFWIYILDVEMNTENGSQNYLNISGVIPTFTTIYFSTGWNLVGYPSLCTNITVANALWGTGADKVEAFNATNPNLISEVDPTYIMKPGEGYWMHVPADTVWTVDW